jgi:tetratricopeptide (TPR) repeat protein
MAGQKGKKRRTDPRRKSAKSSSPKEKSPKISCSAQTDIISTFHRAEKYFHGGKFAEAVDILNNTPSISQIDKLNNKLLYLRLLSFSLSGMGKYIEAEDAARKGLELDPENSDFHFILTFVALTLKDYDKCIEYGNRFNRIYDATGNQDRLFGQFSFERLHLFNNYMGVAYRAKNELPKAEAAFKSALALAPWYSHPYVNLANLYIQKREYNEAEAIIKKGLKNCSQIQELRILKKNLENRATISACMIVKDEEELLANCLESIRSWVAEIIVVDTGSTDRTVEIAQSYGAKIYYEPWQGDFSKPRNLSLSKASCDWIFIIDADEEFVPEDIPLLRQVTAQEKFRLISITVYNVNRESGEFTSFLPSYRLFRREAGFYYDGIVHNQLRYGENEPALRAGIRLKHYGYGLSPEKMKKKIARSKELLEKQLQERPNDAHTHFNYAQLLRGSGENLPPEVCDLIIEHAGRAIALTDQKASGQLNTHLMAHHQLITTYLYMKRYDEAERLCHHVLKIKPDYLDPILSLGHIYSHMKQLDKAEEYFNKYLETQANYNESEETTNFILLYVRARHVAYYGLALIAHFRGEIERAEKYYRMILEEFGPYLDTCLRLARLYLDRMELEKALESIERELSIHPSSDLGHLYKAEYFARRNNLAEAERYLEKSLELTEGSQEVYEKAGCFYANRGRFDEAVIYFDKLTRLVPNYANGFKLFGKAHYDLDNFTAALSGYRRYLELNPGDAGALNDAANCHFQLKEYIEAEEYYNKALAIDANLGAAYRNLGLTELYLGKPEEALVLLEKYSTIAPEDVEIELAMGTIYSRMGRFSESIPHFEKYLSARPENIEALYGISECYFQLGHRDSALIGYNQVLKLNPDHQMARNRIEEIKTVGAPA